jgi:hypothetical protein
LKRELVLVLKGFNFQRVLRIEKNIYCQAVPCPGKKSFASSKKAVVPFFLNAGFRRFSPVIPLPPRFFAETKKGQRGRFLPALFVFGACLFPRATKKRV